MSPETLAFLSELLDQVNLPASHPEFERMAARIITARRELEEARAHPGSVAAERDSPNDWPEP